MRLLISSALIILSTTASFADNSLQTPIVQTFNVRIAQIQSQQHPENIEAAFVLFTALTRADRLEPALAQLRHVSALTRIENQPALDGIIHSLEETLGRQPTNIEARYSLRWAHYAKSKWLLKQENQPHQIMRIKEVSNPTQSVCKQEIANLCTLAVNSFANVLKQEPDDMWAALYMAHIKAECSGNLSEAEITFQDITRRHPDSQTAKYFLRAIELTKGSTLEQKTILPPILDHRA